jgi:tetratricopeptide (TPR) repeat protein
MSNAFVRWSSAFAIMFCVGAAPLPAFAQSDGLGSVLNAPAAISEARAKQAELFERLLDDPDNLDLMFEYATLSIRLEDYEAAISTLERMLIYRQDLSRVRLELAVAYFNLGSYEASELYFDQVLADPETPTAVAARINRYKEAIDARTKKSAFSGITSVGVTYATNATLGPDSDQLLIDIFQTGDPVLVNIVEGNEEADFGMRALVSASHVYDLQQADLDVWRTDFSAFALRYFNTEEGDVGFARLRTGPRLSLNAEQFGPKIRPYVEAQYLNSQDRGLFASYGVGLEYSNTLSPVLSTFADAGIRYRNFFRKEFTDNDAFNVYTAAGLAYIPARDLVLRGTGFFEIDAADAPENTNYEIGLRLSGEYQYDSGIEWVDRKWSASAYTELRTRFFDEEDPLIGLDVKRRDIDVRAGISHVFAIQGGFGVQLDIDGLFRESNIVNFDLSNLSTTVSLQYRF